MTRTLSPTKIALMRAGEELFAREGIDGARVADILKLAGQANDSAINYHFGSRWGMVQAILARHVDLMEPLREVRAGRLKDLVRAIIVPTAARLETPEGRDFLRILSQLADRTAFPGGEPPAALRATVLLQQLAALDEAIDLPDVRRRERIAQFVLFVTSSLAYRAKELDSDVADLSSHDDYVADLVAMATALLRA